jgi:hypothetical protein
MENSSTAIAEDFSAIEVDDHNGHNVELLTTRTPTLVSAQRPEPEPQVWRGVFAPAYKWKVLFSQQVTIQTAQLPHLKPYITIDRRTLEGEDDRGLV